MFATTMYNSTPAGSGKKRNIPVIKTGVILLAVDCVNGIKGLLNDEGKFSNNPLGLLNWLKEQNPEVSIILLVKDFHKFYDDPSINRTMKELSSSLKETNHNLVISSHIFPSSEELDELMTIINLPLPDQKELKNYVTSHNKIFNYPYEVKLTNDIERKKLISKLKFNFLKLQIPNEFDYGNNLKKGLADIIYDKSKSIIAYETNLKSFQFIF